MLHDPGHNRAGAIGNAVHIDFDRFFQESVDQYGLSLGNDKGFGDVTFELRFVVTDFHSPSAQNKAGSDQDRVTDFFHHVASLAHIAGNSAGWLVKSEFFQQALEFLAVFGVLDGIHAGSDNGNPQVGKGACQVQGRLPTKLDDHPIRLDTIANIQYVFCR